MAPRTNQHRIIVEVASRAVLDGRIPCDLYGTPRQLMAFAEAYYATRRFDRVLLQSDDVEDVAAALAVKRAAAARFRQVYGVDWPA